MFKRKYQISKIVISTGIGKNRNLANFDDKVLPEIQNQLALITGQKPAVRRAKKAIAGFKTRVNDVIGLQVTLRGERMMAFLKKIGSIVLPRVKDFRGLDIENVDSNGNLNIGLKEQFTFPEINMENSRVNFGLQITFVPFFRDREKAIEFYRELGLPLKK